MKRSTTLLAILFLILAGRLPAEPAPAHLWSHVFTCTGDEAYAPVLIVDYVADGAGDVILFGSFESSIEIGGVTYGPTDPNDDSIFLAKYDTAGDLLWIHEFGTDTSFCSAGGLALDAADNIVIAGIFVDHIDLGGSGVTWPGASGYLAKYDPDGVFMWSRLIAAGSFGISGLEIDAMGRILYAGELYGEANFLGGWVDTYISDEPDIFVVALDAIGEFLWQQFYASPNDDNLWHFKTDSANRILISGYSSEDSLDFGGGPLECNVGYRNVYLAKLDTDGSHMWSRCFPGEPMIDVMAVDPDDKVLIGGSFIYGTDFGGGTIPFNETRQAFLARYDADGAYEWCETFTDTMWATVSGVAVDEDGYVYLGGSFGGQISFGGTVLIEDNAIDQRSDDFFVKLTPALEHVWSGQYGANFAFNEYPRLVLDAQSDLICLGAFNEQMEFDGDTYQNSDHHDFYLVKFDGNGRPVADAGPDRSAPTMVLVDCFGSAVDPEGDAIVDVLWEPLETPFGSNTWFDGHEELTLAVMCDTEGVVVMSFKAFDGEAWSEPDTMNVFIADVLPVQADGQGMFETIDDALEGCSDGQVIELGSGIYTNVGNTVLDFRGKAVTVRSSGKDAASCVIDLQGGPEDERRGFVFVSGEDTTSVLEGVTVTGGWADTTFVYGGGVYSEGASPLIRDCVFEGNSARRGGGFAAVGGSPVLRGCAFTDNTAFLEAAGGGVYALLCDSLTVSDCTFEDNAAHLGGGAHVQGGPASFTGCTFTGNTVAGEAGGYGGGLSAQNYAHLWVENCLFHANAADTSEMLNGGNGGAISLRGRSELDITGSTLVGNRADLGAGIRVLSQVVRGEDLIVAFNGPGVGVSCGDSGSVDLSCSDVYGNDLGDWVLCLSDQLGVAGNISFDPLFCDLAAGDLTLHENSPCLPGGNSCGVTMGALEEGCQGTAVPGEEGPPLVTRLEGVRPNPFNPRTEIRFSLAEAVPVDLRIYDLAGRCTRTLAADRVFPAGAHAVTWDGADDRGRPASSGTYLFRWQAGAATSTVRAVLVR